VCIESYAFQLFALPEIERLGSTTITVVPLSPDLISNVPCSCRTLSCMPWISTPALMGKFLTGSNWAMPRPSSRTSMRVLELERTAGNLARHSLHRAYRVNCTDQIRTSRERYADEVRGSRQQRWQFQTTNGESQKKGRPMADAPCADCIAARSHYCGRFCSSCCFFFSSGV
jgi:hypothetical protein